MRSPAAGKPTDSPYVESFSESYRDERLNLRWLLSHDDDVRRLKRGDASTTPYARISPSATSLRKTSKNSTTARSPILHFDWMRFVAQVSSSSQ